MWKVLKAVNGVIAQHEARRSPQKLKTMAQVSVRSYEECIDRISVFKIHKRDLVGKIWDQPQGSLGRGLTSIRLVEMRAKGSRSEDRRPHLNGIGAP